MNHGIYIAAEIGKSFEQALDSPGLVMTIEVVGAEVDVFDTVAKHEVGGGEHGSGHSKDGFFCSAPGLDTQELGAQVAFLTRIAAQAAVTKAVLSQVPLFRTRVERRLPALSSLRGHRPAQDMRWPASGKRVMSTPISATITRAVRSLTPGIVVSRRVDSTGGLG